AGEDEAEDEREDQGHGEHEDQRRPIPKDDLQVFTHDFEKWHEKLPARQSRSVLPVRARKTSSRFGSLMVSEWIGILAAVIAVTSPGSARLGRPARSRSPPPAPSPAESAAPSVDGGRYSTLCTCSRCRSRSSSAGSGAARSRPTSIAAAPRL